MTIRETIQSAAQSVLTYIHDNMPEGAVFEDTVVPSSANGVKSSGIYTALQTKADETTVTTLSGTVSDIGSDVSTIKGQITSIQSNLDNKQDKLTFDSAPTAGSTNPVTSEGIKTALDEKQDTLTAGSGIDITNKVISAVLPTSDPGVNNVLYIL